MSLKCARVTQVDKMVYHGCTCGCVEFVWHTNMGHPWHTILSTCVILAHLFLLCARSSACSVVFVIFLCFVFCFLFFNSSSLFVIDVNKCATKWCARVTRMSVSNLVWHTNIGYPGTPFFPLAQFDFIVCACNAFLLRLFLCFVYCFHSFVIVVHFL